MEYEVVHAYWKSACFYFTLHAFFKEPENTMGSLKCTVCYETFADSLNGWSNNLKKIVVPYYEYPDRRSYSQTR